MTVERLGTVVAEYVLECLDELHAGTGDVRVVDIPQPDGNKVPTELALFARYIDTIWSDGNGPSRPALAESALKGAFRAAAPEDVRDTLFGAVSPGDEETGTGGLLVPYSALLIAGSVPHNPELPRHHGDTETFIRIGNAVSRRTQAVSDEMLYAQEVIPKGSRFRGRIGLRAPSALNASPTTDAELLGMVGELLAELSARDGFSLGADRSFMGRVRLEETTLHFRGSILTKETKTRNRRPERVTIRKRDMEIEVTAPEASLSRGGGMGVIVPGPMLISDPTWIDPGEHKNTLRNLGRGASSWSPSPPSSHARAVRQALRLESHKLELRDAFIKGGDVWTKVETWLNKLAEEGKEEFEHVMPNLKEIEKLTRTQRLFGVAGWGGIVWLHELSSSARHRFRHPVIQIESLTQAALQNHLAFREGPADIELAFRLRFDESRLRRAAPEQADGDIAHFWNTLEGLAGRGIRLGHAKGVGLGAGRLSFACDLPDPRPASAEQSAWGQPDG